MSFSLSFGMSERLIKKMVLVPLTLRIPYANLPSFLAKDLLQVGCVFACAIRSLYSNCYVRVVQRLRLALSEGPHLILPNRHRLPSERHVAEGY